MIPRGSEMATKLLATNPAELVIVTIRSLT